MRRAGIILILLLLSTVPVVLSADKLPGNAAPNEKLTFLYHSKNNFFEMKYPVDLLAVDPGTETFYSYDLKSSISIADHFIGNREKWEGDYKKLLRHLAESGVQIKHKEFRDKYFVVMGEQDGNVVYFKRIMLVEHRDLGFKMVFPKIRRKEWEPILALCSNSFKSSVKARGKNGANGAKVEPIDYRLFGPPKMSGKTARTQPDAPKHFRIKAGNGMMRLSWEKLQGADGYVIELNGERNYEKKSMTWFTGKEELAVAGLENSRTYTVSIFANAMGRNSKKIYGSVFLPARPAKDR